MKSATRFLLAVMVCLFLVPGAYAQNSDFDDILPGQGSAQPFMTIKKLAKQKKAIVIAGGRYYTQRLIWGRVTGSLTGYFFRHPNKPRQTFYGGADSLLIKSGYSGNGHRVSEVAAGSWVMYSWLGQMPNVSVSPKDSFSRPMAKFKVKPGEVIYIGELLVNHYVEEDKTGKVIVPKLIELRNNMKNARAALKSEYPNLVKHMKYRPLALVGKK